MLLLCNNGIHAIFYVYNKRNVKMKKNDILEVIIDQVLHNGKGIAYIDNYTVYVDSVLPKEKVKIKVLKVVKNIVFAKNIKIIVADENRCEILDRKAMITGIMPLQYMNYSKQLDLKRKFIQTEFENENLFEKICANSHVNEKFEIMPVIGMKDPFFYRNKAQIPVRQINGELEIGFFRINSHDFVPMEKFYIQDKLIDEALVKIRDIMREYDVKSYNEEKHTGFLRNIIVRYGRRTGQMQIVLVTSKTKFFNVAKIVKRIVDSIDRVVSVVQNVQNMKSNVIMGEKDILLYGKDYIEDELLNIKYKISSHSFYQVNPVQTEVLYKHVLDVADINSNDIVLDAYCGIGTISLIIAKKAQKVIGVEKILQAVKMAKENARINNIFNAEFYADNVENFIDDNNEKFNVIIVDPPRKGLDIKFIHTVIRKAPDKIIYVSCNPKTLARDLKIFTLNNYAIKNVQPIDMFPQTTSVETVCLLSKL